MATYSTIKGFEVQSLGSDPYASLAAGGTWASGPSTNTGRKGVGGLGTQTAAIAACGNAPPVGVLCESYNGTAWTEVNDLSTARTTVGSSGGSQTAGLVAGGNAPGGDVDNVEKFDGTCWTETGDLNQIRHSGACMGATNTAAIYSGGSNYPPGTGSEGYLAETESWNGSAWTEVGDLNTGRRYVAGVGPSTAALLAGGAVPPGSTDTAVAESWNGSAWTEVGDLNTARRYGAMSGGANAQTASLVFGGYVSTSGVANTESYDGSTWAEVADLGTAIKAQLGSTTGTNALALSAFGGPPNPTASEEWTVPSAIHLGQEGQLWYNTASLSLKGIGGSLPTGTWASSPSLNTGRGYAGCAGNAPDSAMVFAGETPAATANTETYNGSAWTEVNNVNTARTYVMSFGVTTASMCVGGTPPQTGDSETWDGTNWTEGNNLNSARHAGGGSGVTTAGLVFGGGVWNQPPLHKLTESYDGSSWTEVGDLNNSHMTNVNSLGLTQTAAICSSGYQFPTPIATAYTEEWDGSSWTEIADLNTARYYAGGSGSVTSGLIIGGEVPAPTFYSKVELYNGTAWTEIADMGTARAHFPGTTTNGPATGVVVAGGGPGFQTSTETFAAGTGVLTITAT